MAASTTVLMHPDNSVPTFLPYHGHLRRASPVLRASRGYLLVDFGGGWLIGDFPTPPVRGWPTRVMEDETPRLIGSVTCPDEWETRRDNQPREDELEVAGGRKRFRDV